MTDPNRTMAEQREKLACRLEDDLAVGQYHDGDFMRNDQATLEVITALRPTPDQSRAGEPVWWRWRFKTEGRWSKWIALEIEDVEPFRELQGGNLGRGHCELEPLYTRTTIPPTEGERVALADALPPVQQIEMVKGFSPEETAEPMWRVAVSGIVTDFPTETAANNFRNAILALIRSSPAIGGAREKLEEAAQLLDRRASGYASRGSSIFNGKLISGELHANAQLIRALSQPEEKGR